MSNILLGINIDHVATLRQARGTRYPEPLHAALLAEEAGADGITLHLREDRRHIQERDVRMLIGLLQTRMNLEIAVTEDMLRFAEEIKPHHVCLVPERREELTTEGGLDVAGQLDPDAAQIDAAIACGAPTIELHTGAYADAHTSAQQHIELQRLIDATAYAAPKLVVNAGHGLHYHNVQPIAAIKAMNELNIGHAIVAHALFVGFKSAVQEMKALMLQARTL